MKLTLFKTALLVAVAVLESLPPSLHRLSSPTISSLSLMIRAGQMSADMAVLEKPHTWIVS